MHKSLSAAAVQKRLDKGLVTVFASPAVVMITGSKGRKDIIRDAGLDWAVLKNNFDEEAVKADKSAVDSVEKASKYSEELALCKLAAVKDFFVNAAVITADTVVFDKRLLEKPRTEKEAYEMIRGLNGSRHHVITGVGICDKREREGLAKCRGAVYSFACVSEVLLSGVTDGAIAETIRLENPCACSGGYTIDGVLGRYFTILSGSRENIIGLPLREVLEALNRA